MIRRCSNPISLVELPVEPTQRTWSRRSNRIEMHLAYDLSNNVESPNFALCRQSPGTNEISTSLLLQHPGSIATTRAMSRASVEAAAAMSVAQVLTRRAAITKLRTYCSTRSSMLKADQYIPATKKTTLNLRSITSTGCRCKDESISNNRTVRSEGTQVLSAVSCAKELRLSKLSQAEQESTARTRESSRLVITTDGRYDRTGMVVIAKHRRSRGISICWDVAKHTAMQAHHSN